MAKKKKKISYAEKEITASQRGGNKLYYCTEVFVWAGPLSLENPYSNMPNARFLVHVQTMIP